MKKTQRKIVRVDWLDAHGGVLAGWKDISSVAKSKPVLAMSIGILLKETKDKLVVCPHFVGSPTELSLSDDADTAADGAIGIPRSWVKKVVVLGYIDQPIVYKEKT
jgi:hypothetical protein